MKIKLESREDYELYVRKYIKANNYTDKQEKALIALVMSSFDDGIRLTMNKLYVEVSL